MPLLSPDDEPGTGPISSSDDAATNIIRLQRGTRVGAALAGQDNPDDAARALDLSDATGIPASMIYPSLDSFERKHKAALTLELLRNNQHLTDYANHSPMAPIVSNDDWGNMDKAGETYKRVATLANRPWWELGAAGTAHGIATGYASQVSAVGRLIGSEQIAGINERVTKAVNEGVPVSEEDQQSLSYLVGEGFGQLLSLFGTGGLWG